MEVRPPAVTEEMLYHYLKSKGHKGNGDVVEARKTSSIDAKLQAYFADSNLGGVLIYDRVSDKIMVAPIRIVHDPLTPGELQSERALWDNYLFAAWWHTWVGDEGPTRHPRPRRLFTEYDVGVGLAWMLEAQIVDNRRYFSSPRILCDAEDVRKAYDQEEEPEKATVSYIHD